jgi:ubiquitin
MNKKEIYEKLKKIKSKLEDGLQGEFDGYEDTDDQPDARLIEANCELEDLIDLLTDEINQIV